MKEWTIKIFLFFLNCKKMPANDQVLYYYRHKYEKNIILPIKINLILEKKT
jgi:hypothetical protein